ncbi:MAG: hypothetical protein IKP28_05055 [Clostridia bacterium]|nr:hypothetical protein [Clostridia bacterium]
MKNMKGITLVALVITIIVLLIISATVITSVLSEENLFEKTNNAVEKWNDKTNEESNSLANVLDLMDNTYFDTEAPTPPTEIIVSKIKGTKANVQAMGGTDNSNTVLYKYSLDNGTTWSDAVPSENEYSLRGLSKATDYTLIAKSVDASGNESSAIETAVEFRTDSYAGNIGEYVHYNKNLEIGSTDSVDDDWVVFYEDLDINGNIDPNGCTYLIAADYVPRNIITTETSGTAGRAGLTQTPTSAYIYNVVWRDVAGTLSSYPTATVTSTRLITNNNRVATNFSSWYQETTNGNTTTGNLASNKHKAVALLLDSTSWSDFIIPNGAEQGIQAVGTPTIELWAASWEQRGYDKLYWSVYGDTAYAWGYGIGESTNNLGMEFDVDNLTKNGHTGTNRNPVYFPYDSPKDGCNGYLLASPSIGNNSNYYVSIMFVTNDGKIGALSAYGVGWETNLCVRPVVSIPTSLIYTNRDLAEANNGEIYYIDY